MRKVAIGMYPYQQQQLMPYPPVPQESVASRMGISLRNAPIVGLIGGGLAGRLGYNPIREAIKNPIVRNLVARSPMSLSMAMAGLGGIGGLLARKMFYRRMPGYEAAVDE